MLAIFFTRLHKTCNKLESTDGWTIGKKKKLDVATIMQ